MIFQIEEIYSILDQIKPNTERKITLPNTEIKISINSRSNNTFNFLYQKSKEETTKCSCCGVKPSHLEYSQHNGLRMVVSENVYMNLDHDIPKSLGGLSHKNNLKVMCSKCNERKADDKPDREMKEVFELSSVFDQLCKRYRKFKESLKKLKTDLIKEGFTIIDKDVFKSKIVKKIKKIIYDFEMNQLKPKLVYA